MTDYNPYRPPSATVNDVPTPGDGSELADRGTRLGAAVIDSIIYALLIVPAVFLIALNSDRGTDQLYLMMVAFIAMIPVLIVNLVFLHKTGQTIAKKMLKIKIVRTDGSRAGLGRIFWLRMFIPGVIGNIPLLGPVFGLTDPLFIFQQSRKCLHDLMADTIVVKA